MAVNVVSLSDLLTEDQLTEVDQIVSKIRSNKADLNSLRDYLRSQSESLLERGVVSDYLYWSLVYHLELL